MLHTFNNNNNNNKESLSLSRDVLDPRPSQIENNLSKLENNFKSFQEQVHGSWSLN